MNWDPTQVNWQHATEAWFAKSKPGAQVNARASAARGPLSNLLAAGGGVAALALLLVFQQVVQSAVAQGVLRRSVAEQLHSATWQCKALRSQRERSDCMALIPLATRTADTAWPRVGQL